MRPKKMSENVPPPTKKMTLDGTEQWWLNGQLHRTDGPALTKSDGEKQWWTNGKLHRTNGPAVANPLTGRQEWWQNGKLHRTDGPAFRRENKTGVWVIHGKPTDPNLIVVLNQTLTEKQTGWILLAHPQITEHNIETITEWDPTTKPTQHQLDTWRTLAALTPQ